MPLRLYISNGPASYAPTSPIHRGTWTNGANTYSRALSPRPSGGPNIITVGVGVNANLRSVLNFRTISEPAIAAGTLSGTMQWMAMVLESNAALNAYFMVHAWITVGDSSTVRGTLLNMSQGATEWPTTEAGRTEGSKAITSVNVQVGDRICIEWGYITTPASSSTAYTGRYRVGGISDTDLTANSTDFNQSSWVEFSGGEGIFYPAVSNLVSEFTSSIPAELAAGAYGGSTMPAINSGRLRITADGSVYSGVMADGYAFSTDGFYIQVPTVLTPSGTITQAYVGMSIIDNVAGGGKYIGALIDTVIGKIVFYNWDGYSDASEVQVTYSSTTHRWVRVRRSGQQILWDTSPDGTTWTNRRTLTTGPSWMNYNNLALLLEAYKDGTPSSYAELDNLNTVPPPQNLIRGYSDSVTVADAVARASVRPRALADSAGVAETLARLVARARAIADSAAVADSVTRAGGPVRAVADTVGLADANTKIFSRIRGIAETVGLADSAGQAGVRARPGADTVGLVDTLARAATNWARPTPDTVVLADANTKQLSRPRAGTDTIGFADSLTQQMARIRPITDTVTAADAVGRVQGRYGAGADTVAVADTVTRASARPRAGADTLGLVDVFSRAPMTRPRATADTVGLAEALARASTRARAWADSVAAGDAVARFAAGFADLAAEVDLADFVGLGNQPFRFLDDSVALAHETVAGRGVDRDASDGVVLDEWLQLSGAILARPVADAVTVVDVELLAELALFAAIADTVSVVDAATAGAVLAVAGAETVALAVLVDRLRASARLVTDTVLLAELALAGQAYATSVNDTVTAADTVARAAALAAAVADTVALAGAAGTTGASARGTADTVALAELTLAGRLFQTAGVDTVQLAELTLAGRLSLAAAGDTVGVADAVARMRALPRNGSDFVYFGDIAGRDRVLARAVAEALTVADQGRVPSLRARSVADLVKLVDAAYAIVIGPHPIIIARPHSVRQVMPPQSIKVVTPVHGIRRSR